MHQFNELPVWDSLFRQIVYKQLGTIKGVSILDFGSGSGITANYYASLNKVTAIEPDEESCNKRWMDYAYSQIVGDVSELKGVADNAYDVIICHNVLEYIEDKETVIKELARVLKPGGFISVVKHNRNGRVFQMMVLLDDFDKANALLDGDNSYAEKFGAIRYYEDEDLTRWAPELSIEQVYGIRTFFDLQQNQQNQKDENWQQKMIELECRVSEMDDFRNVAFFHHLILEKK